MLYFIYVFLKYESSWLNAKGLFIHMQFYLYQSVHFYADDTILYVADSSIDLAAGVSVLYKLFTSYRYFTHNFTNTLWFLEYLKMVCEEPASSLETGSWSGDTH